MCFFRLYISYDENDTQEHKKGPNDGLNRRFGQVFFV
jgi:hypothetical protein